MTLPRHVAVLLGLALITASGARAQLAHSWMIPAAAHTPGAGGTYWRSDVSLHNPHDTSLPVVIQLLPTGLANWSAPTMTLDLYPYETFNLWDALGPDLFDHYGTGAVLVYVDTNRPCSTANVCDFLAFSRTYTTDPQGGAGEYAQTIPGLRVDQGVDLATYGYTAGILNDGQLFRCNIGAASWTGAWTTLRVDVQDSDGTILATEELAVPPFGHVQRRLRTAVTGGSLVYYLVSGPDASLVFPYASVVNQDTGDPSFFQAQPSVVGVTVPKATAVTRAYPQPEGEVVQLSDHARRERGPAVR